MGQVIYLLLGISLCVYFPSAVVGPVVGDDESTETTAQDTDTYDRYTNILQNQIAIMKQMAGGLGFRPQMTEGSGFRPQMVKLPSRPFGRSTSLINSGSPVMAMVSSNSQLIPKYLSDMANTVIAERPPSPTNTYPNQQRAIERDYSFGEKPISGSNMGYSFGKKPVSGIDRGYSFGPKQISGSDKPYVPNDTKKSIVNSGSFSVKRFPDGSYEALGVRVPANFKFTPEILADYSREIVDAHNEYRIKHGVPLLELDPKISEYSQMWADHLMDIYTMKHSPEEMRPNYGENIHFNPISYTPAKEVVRRWYSEAENVKYDYNSNELTPGAGHFTQVVWRNSQYIGVGVASNKQKGIFVVCNYELPGNVEDEFTENVLRPKY